MTEIAVQPSFNSGEWAPNLFARVDVAKYRSAAALLENFFVDYRGGASTRPGSSYVIQARDSANPVRIIPYQASNTVGYVVEIGNGYMRFIYNGAPVLETGFAISGATQANPCVITVVGNNYNVNDVIYISGVTGMTQLNNRFFKVIGVSGNNVTLGYLLDGTNINSTAYTAYSAGGTAARVYTISSPYTSADDLRLVKFAQSVNQLILCHPSHPVYVLTSISANNWTLTPAVFGSSISVPSATAATNLGAGTTNYAYEVTAIDSLGQESAASSPATLANYLDIAATAGSTNTVSWTAIPGAVAYNVYAAAKRFAAAVVSGAQYGFIGSTQGVAFTESYPGVAADFTITPPIPYNPFTGFGVASIAVTAAGAYTTVPTITFSGTPVTPAVGLVSLGVTVAAINSGGTGFAVNDLITLSNGVILKVTTVAVSTIVAVSIVNFGSITSGSTPANPVAQVSTSGGGTGSSFNLTWGVKSIAVTQSGSGYTVAPTIAFSSGAATATATLSSATNNPAVPGFVQQRLVLANMTNSPATFYMSRSGQYFNFDTSRPITAADSVSGTLVSGTLNTIKSVIGSAAGMILLSDSAMWLVNGGSPQAAISASSIAANPQSYIGANDVPPIVANYDILYIQATGSAVRSASYNVYMNVFTGEDISVLSSHLFFGYTVDEWCWAEQPYYTAQAIRSDGYILSLTYLKEQQFIGWSHYITNGTYKSICTVKESSGGSILNAVYTVVERTINGVTVQYIERFANRTFANGYVSAWCVDAGVQYSGSPATTFTGAEQLAGMTVTGLADGIVIPPFTMPTNGIFTLAAPASTVTVGLAYTCKLQTLPLDVGEPSVQGKLKKITAVDIRVVDTLGLKIGSSFSTLVPMKDLVLGNVSSTLTGQPSQVVTGLVSGDAMTILDNTYTVPGQYCIQQDQPYPATILGCFPRFESDRR